MADIKPNAQENKEGDVVEPVCDSSGATQEPLQRHTSSLKNNAAGLSEQLSSDGLPNPLNGAQPSSFVPSSVPAVPHTAQAAHSLPSGALVNGPGSHPASEESCGLNKNSTMSNNVLVEAQDAQLRQSGRDTSPQVLPPPSELQSDALKNPAGLVLKTLATTQPGANNTSPSDSEASEAELPYQALDTTLSGHSPQSHQTPINQIWTAEGVEARAISIWDLNTTESSESSSDGFDGTDALHWDSQKELIRALWKNRTVDSSLETNTAGVGVMSQLTSQRQRKRKIHLVGTAGSPEKVYNCSTNHTYKKWHIEEEEDDEDFDISNINEDDSPCKKADVQTSVNSCQEHPSDSPVIIKKLIVRADCPKDNPSVSLFSRKPKQLKTEQSKQEPSFFPCTMCNVNFKEKRHLHRHVMYHLDGQNHQARHHEKVPRPFICRECGRSFRDRSSLLKHIIIHQERREKLMEEIQGLNKLRDEGRNAKLQCPQCVFGTNCPKMFVQHAKTHNKDKRYYLCAECNHVALTERELEAHLYAMHCDTLKSKYKNVIKDEESEFLTDNNDESSHVLFHCKVCRFSTQNEDCLKRHCELIHQQSDSDDECENPPFKKALNNPDQYSLADPSKKAADLKRLQLKPKFCIKKPAFWKRADFRFWSGSVADFYMRDTADTQKTYKGLTSSQFKCSIVSSANKLSPSLWRSDKPSKLSPKLTEKIDVTTGLPYVEEDNQLYDHVVSGISERTKYPSNVDVLLTSKMIKPGQMLYHSYNSDKSQGGSNDLTGRKSEAQAVTQKTPSKRKMSTPFHNSVDKVVDNVLPKLNPKLKETTTPEDTEEDNDYEDTYDFSAYTSEATANFLDSSENERNPYARSYFIRRQRGSSLKENPAPAADIGRLEKNPVQVDHHFNKTEDKDGEYDSNDIQKLIIKEECIESSVCDDSPESPTTTGTHNQSLSYDYDFSPYFGTERKSCPYCPAVFESGVGLSNHVRGHLYRLGLSYDARHVVSPERVASQDRQPRVRRKVPSVVRRIKKAEKPESQAEHTCPLCWGWFDTKTGLSNHVRGHLKQIGKTSTSTSKSPVCILNELLKDEQEHQNILQILNRKQLISRPTISQKFIGSDGLFLTPMGIPVKVQHGCQLGQNGTPTPWDPSANTPRQEGVEREDFFPKRKSIEIGGVIEPSPSTLGKLLRKRKLDKDDADKNHFIMTKERVEGRQNQQASNLETHWAHERNASNKKICIHCNTTFPSAVSLSNHLRAYARRKRVAMLEGTTYSCILKKPRLRAGPKNTLFSALPCAVEEMYRLTCRFCDLVFQGPLSIQEDWLRHLQRHLMHTSVPRTGAGMVEVLRLHKETPSLPPQENPSREHPTSNEPPTAHEPQTHHEHSCLEHPSPHDHPLPQQEPSLPHGPTLPNKHPETHEHPELHDEHPLHHAHPSSNEHPSLEQHTATSFPELLPVAS
ncbi:zinc finger protein 644-like [Oncorhynchus masou masou]|uniref:zinc finger protein 644-like n=1 Tax=Oncorhynchus masou masou TaxID=90313 RepID=UPI003182C98C